MHTHKHARTHTHAHKCAQCVHIKTHAQTHMRARTNTHTCTDERVIDANQPPSMWPEAWTIAHQTDDLMPTNSDPSRLSPFEQRTGKPPDSSRLHAGFSTVCVWQNPNDRDKKAPGARKGVYLGWDPLTDCARVLLHASQRARLSLPVTFVSWRTFHPN